MVVCGGLFCREAKPPKEYSHVSVGGALGVCIFKKEMRHSSLGDCCKLCVSVCQVVKQQVCAIFPEIMDFNNIR